MALFSALAGGLVAVGKYAGGFIYPKVKSMVRFRSNLEKLRKEMGKLINLGNGVKEQIEAAERSGRIAAPAVTKWLEEFENIKNEVNSIEASVESNDGNEGKLCPTPNCCCLGCWLGVKVGKYLTEVRRLIEAANFPSGMVVENYRVKKVQHIPGPSIAGQSTASKNLLKVMNLLNDDDDGVSRIGVWGMGGVGKTTLVKNLNNKLETAAAAAQPFSIIIWVTVSKESNLERLQTQLLKRLNLAVEVGESMESTASRLNERLKREKRFLLILDDVWEAIDLDYLGVPQTQPEFHSGHKIILTTRSLDVCRQMKTDIDVKVDVLNEKESWQLFTKNVGKEASLQHIKPIARKVSRECSGLPLAIVIVGASMRGKTTEALWKDALNALQRSVPRIKGIEDKVYKPLKWSYDSLFFQGMDIKSCFLYCCLYPEDFSIEVKELVQCWIAEGLLGEVEKSEDSMNRGIALVENLKDSCLLEKGNNMETVRMHDVVRDVALWIASSSLELDGCNNKSLVQSGIGLNQISEDALSESLKRVSFMYNDIIALPDCTIQCPMVSSLLLQDNLPLEIVPEGFLQGFQALNVLNLSKTNIRTLPFSLLQLSGLRALLLQRCRYLNELPPIGNLRSLEVLDCSSTDLELLPEGMENLTNLRLLDLSETCLTHIPNGIISQLSRLEIIDMRYSFYTWGAMREVERGRTPFDELRCLDRLSALFINLDCYNLAFEDISWIERLKRFNIVIGPSQTNAKTAEVMKFGWVTRSGKFTRSETFMKQWVISSEPVKMPTDLPEEYHFGGLKSLTITDCDLKFQLARVSGAEFDLLPNLEELTLHFVSYLESISELVHHLRLRFSRLRIIKVPNCNRLKYLFSSTSFVQTLKNLEFVTINYCEVFVELFENASSSQSSEELLEEIVEHASSSQSSEELSEEIVEHATSSQTLVLSCIVPNLRIMKLRGLPKLVIPYQQHQSFQHLEKLEVIDCNQIRKLPFTTQNANTIKEIRGESQWWNDLEWDDEDTKSSLQQYFKPC